MSLTLTVHRATQEIGGNCIELRSACGRRIVLDVGRPLDAARGATGLLPGTLDRTAEVDGVLVSHPHQDHYGLLDELPAAWPVYCGAATEKLIRLTSGLFGPEPGCEFRHWAGGRPIEIGPFRVTPLLTDHSAFDAHMLLIEADGQRVLYSGDFRTHGRKAALVERLMADPPPEIDVLLLEGTNLGSDKPTKSEADLEGDFVALSAQTPGRVFVAWSAQNLDRTVTLYRACLKTGRTLVVDLYTAEVLKLLADHGKLPQPGWRGLKVVITRRMRALYRAKGREAFVEEVAPFAISAKQLSSLPRQWVIMTRPSLVRDYEAAGVKPDATDAWCWSMWRGYLKEADGQALKAWFEAGGAKAGHLHTSGHAAPADLRAFARAINPRRLVPIHGVAWDAEADGFPPILRLADGEPALIQ